MQTLELNGHSVGKRMDKKQREKAGRLIRQALVMATFAAAVVVMPQAANAASVTANGTSTAVGARPTITIDNNNITTEPPGGTNDGGTISDGDSVSAVNGGALNLINGTSITNSDTLGVINGGRVISSGVGSTITADNFNVDTIGLNQIVIAQSGGQITITGPSTITGTLADYVGLGRAGIVTVAAVGNDSVVNLTDTTIITSGYHRNYYSAGVAARGGGTVNLTNVTVDSTGDRTYGIWTEAANGHINGTNVNITTDGTTSHGVYAWGENSTVDLTGGSITTNGPGSHGVYVLADSIVNLKDLTVTANDPSSSAVRFHEMTTGNPTSGSLTVDNTTLNGRVDVSSGSDGYLNLINGSVLNGSVDVGNGSFSIDSSSTWNNTSPDDTYIPNFTNGAYAFALPANPFQYSTFQYSTLEVDNFIANPGSTIQMNVYAAGESSFSNQVVINDSYTGATTTINKNFTNGYHALPQDGLVLVQGTSPNAFENGDFFDPIKGGLYTYTGSFSNPNNNPQFSLYSSLNGAVVAANVLPVLGAQTALATMPTLFDRQNHFGDDSAESTKGPWARIFGGSQKFESDNRAKTGFDTSLWGVQAGYDLSAKKNSDGSRNYLGLYVGHGSARGDAKQGGRKVGRVELNATSVGAYWTKYNANNAYLNAIAQYSKLNGIKARGEGEEVKPGGSSLALSLEAGKQLNPEKSFIVEPQAQLIYQRTSVDDSTLRASAIRPTATSLKLSNLSAATGRLGVLMQKNPSSGDNFLPWARLNLWHTFGGHTNISSPGSDTLSTSAGGTSAEAQVGFVLAKSKDSKWDVYGGAGYQFDLSGASYSGWKGNLGLRRNW